MDLGWGSLGTLTLGLTYRCNLRCSMCGTWQKGAERSRDELTTEEISRILDEARELGGRELILVGAEPLTRENLPDIVRDAKQRGFPVHIVTNGTLLTPALSSKLVSAGLESATVSIDGPSEIHDEVRGRTGWPGHAADVLRTAHLSGATGAYPQVNAWLRGPLRGHRAKGRVRPNAQSPPRARWGALLSRFA